MPGESSVNPAKNKSVTCAAKTRSVLHEATKAHACPQHCAIAASAFDHNSRSAKTL